MVLKYIKLYIVNIQSERNFHNDFLSFKICFGFKILDFIYYIETGKKFSKVVLNLVVMMNNLIQFCQPKTTQVIYQSGMSHNPQ